MTVTVRLFAYFRETIGQSELTIAHSPGLRPIDVWESLVQQYPSLGQWRSGLKFACNLEFVSPDRVLSPGDEIAFIPPVSGG